MVPLKYSCTLNVGHYFLDLPLEKNKPTKEKNDLQSALSQPVFVTPSQSPGQAFFFLFPPSLFPPPLLLHVGYIWKASLLLFPK